MATVQGLAATGRASGWHKDDKVPRNSSVYGRDHDRWCAYYDWLWQDGVFDTCWEDDLHVDDRIPRGSSAYTDGYRKWGEYYYDLWYSDKGSDGEEDEGDSYDEDDPVDAIPKWHWARSEDGFLTWREYYGHWWGIALEDQGTDSEAGNDDPDSADDDY